MQSNNDNHAIFKTFTELNDDKKENFVYFTKALLIHQNEHNFKLLKCPASTNNLEPTNICNIYTSSWTLYEDISKIFNKSKGCLKTLSPYLKNALEDTTDKENLLRFFRMVVMHNLIKKSLKHKKVEDVESYALLQQMNQIKPMLPNTLQLHLNTDEQITECINNYKLNIGCLITLTDEEYNNLYDLFIKFK